MLINFIPVDIGNQNQNPETSVATDYRGLEAEKSVSSSCACLLPHLSDLLVSKTPR